MYTFRVVYPTYNWALVLIGLKKSMMLGYVAKPNAMICTFEEMLLNLIINLSPWWPFSTHTHTHTPTAAENSFPWSTCTRLFVRIGTPTWTWRKKSDFWGLVSLFFRWWLLSSDPAAVWCTFFSSPKILTPIAAILLRLYYAQPTRYCTSSLNCRACYDVSRLIYHVQSSWRAPHTEMELSMQGWHGRWVNIIRDSELGDETNDCSIAINSSTHTVYFYRCPDTTRWSWHACFFNLMGDDNNTNSCSQWLT